MIVPTVRCRSPIFCEIDCADVVDHHERVGSLHKLVYILVSLPRRLLELSLLFFPFRRHLELKSKFARTTGRRRNLPFSGSEKKLQTTNLNSSAPAYQEYHNRFRLRPIERYVFRSIAVHNRAKKHGENFKRAACQNWPPLRQVLVCDLTKFGVEFLAPLYLLLMSVDLPASPTWLTFCVDNSVAATVTGTKMVVLNATRSTQYMSSSSSSSSVHQTALDREMTGRRKRSSKGQIAGYGSETDDSGTGHVSDSMRSLSSVNAQQQQPQHKDSNSSNPSPKPCHSARLALLCAQNANRMGARTQLSLCPPGKNRRTLQAALRQRTASKQQQLQNMTVTGSSTRRLNSSDPQALFYGLEKLLGNERLEEYEVQEEDFLISTNTFEVDSDEEASSGDEDELLPIDGMFSEEPLDLDDSSTYHLSEPLYTPASIEAGSQANKLPFNRKKLRYFDAVTAEESTATRAYLQTEIRRSKKRTALALCRHLRVIQVEQSRKKAGEAPVDVVESPDDKALLEGGVTVFAHPMTPAMASALLVESLMVNPYESVEGLAACYEGIVAAGVAVLDAPDPTQPNKTRASRSEIMAALAPLLVTTLEQPSGEVILMMAKMRRMCGTARYRRRFVQRIAPALIRPPGGALWCLTHQNDMVPILAAAELILDAAFDIFSKGWYERGRWMLKDSKRAETLSAAATQLRNLSQEPTDSLAFLHPQRRGRIKKTKDHHDEPLAEWEVIAVDRQIHVSISSVLHTDWTRAAVHETVPRPVRHRTTSAGNSRRSSQTDVSPRTPRSPRGAAGFGKAPASPLSESSLLDPTHGAPFAAAGERVQTPPPAPASSFLEPDMSPRPPGALPLPKSPKSPMRNSAELSPKRIVKDASGSAMGSGVTPLSPSASSVGSSEMIAYKPNTGASVASTAWAGPAAHHRMLTSTAAERKRTVAACRALRAQIQRFEDAFIQLHGRPPKGASDRAPLATTYAQYREWKRAIRADAACRIQALFRGASCRWSLLRRNNAAIARVIMKRAGRAGASESAISRISLPTDIGQQDPTAPESFSQTPSSPQWASQVVRPRANSGSSGDGFPSPGTPRPLGSSPNSSPTNQPDTSNMSFADLQARKRDLKQQLKQYDMNFARKHGRMPVKSEKEPIRHLYESYNTLKGQITEIEREGRHLPSAAGSPAPPGATQRTVSPPSVGSDGSDDSFAAKVSPSPVARAKRKLPKPSMSPPIGAVATDLAALKVEKGNLHTMLRSFEKDFFRENRRQVSSFVDIKPVASQYRRYKEIKKAIASLQGEK